MQVELDMDLSRQSLWPLYIYEYPVELIYKLFPSTWSMTFHTLFPSISDIITVPLFLATLLCRLLIHAVPYTFLLLLILPHFWHSCTLDTFTLLTTIMSTNAPDSPRYISLRQNLLRKIRSFKAWVQTRYVDFTATIEEENPATKPSLQCSWQTWVSFEPSPPIRSTRMEWPKFYQENMCSSRSRPRCRWSLWEP